MMTSGAREDEIPPVAGRGRSPTRDHDSLQLDGATPRTLPFRIEGEIAKRSKRRWAQDERFGSWVTSAVLSSSSI
jgi:hypothetical protein